MRDGRGRRRRAPAPGGALDAARPAWLDGQLDELATAGVRLAMIAPALVDGRPLSHPDHDHIWAAFVGHGISPCSTSPTSPACSATAGTPIPTTRSCPRSNRCSCGAAALACTDLIVNGTLERHPDLRIGIVELSSIWVPMYLMMLDGGLDFAPAQRPAGVQLD